MRKLEMKSVPHRTESKMTHSVSLDVTDVRKEISKGLLECDSQFDSGYNSGMLIDEFDSGSCLSSSDLNMDSDIKHVEKTTEASELVFDSGLGLDLSSDLHLTSTTGQTDIPSPTCTSMTADLSWREILQQDEDGDSVLHLMIVRGIIEIIYTFINLIPHPEFLNIFNSLHQTPLHLAVVTHQPRVVRRLVVAGAEVSVRDHRGNTPLHLACQWGDLECIQALTVPAIDKEIEEALVRYPINLFCLPKRVLKIRNYEGETCIHNAVRVGHLKILEFLFSCGGDARFQDGKSGNTALHLSVETRQVNLVHFLLWHCRTCVNVKNYAGMTAIQLAWDMYKHRPDQHLKTIISLLKKNGSSLPEVTQSDSESTSSDSSEEDSDTNSG